MSYHLKQRLLMALIAVPVVFFAIAFVPNKIVKWTVSGVAVVSAALGFYYLIQFYRTMNQIDKSKADSEKWKRKFRCLTNTAESPDNDLTFDEFCEFEDDEILAEVIRELEKMPADQRDVKRAYEIAQRKGIGT